MDRCPERFESLLHLRRQHDLWVEMIAGIDMMSGKGYFSWCCYKKNDIP